MENKLINEILQRGTKLQSPKDLSSQILTAWKAQKEPLPTFTPLIPKWVWLCLSSFFFGIFIWGFSKMSTSSGDSLFGSFLQNVIQELGYSLIGLEEIVLPTAVVFLIMIILNTFLLKYRFQHQRF